MKVKVRRLSDLLFLEILKNAINYWNEKKIY
jgi:hypothetical protein